jgi:hypothetical protein
MTGVMMMIIIIIVNIIPSISDDVTGIRGNIYIHSKGMKLNACSLILLCQISDKNERKIVETSSRVLKEPRRRPHIACLLHINNNQTYITL